MDEYLAYTNDSQSSTNGNAARPSTDVLPDCLAYHTRRALQHMQDVSTRAITMTQYFDHTFSILVSSRATREPVVMSINEDYEALVHDLSSMFGNARLISVDWGKDLPYANSVHELNTKNTTAMLRLLKSRSGKDWIRFSS